MIHESNYYLEAERDNNDGDETVVTTRRRAVIRRKQKRYQILDRNRSSFNEIHSSPEYETLNVIDNNRLSDNESDHPATLKSTMRLKDQYDRFRANEMHRHTSRYSEFQKNRRKSTEMQQSSTTAMSCDDTRYQSCISLSNCDISNISGTPKRSMFVNYFESNLSNICRVSDYRGGHPNLVDTPEIQKACSSDGSTVKFWKNTVQALGICFLVWNYFRNKIIKKSKK